MLDVEKLEYAVPTTTGPDPRATSLIERPGLIICPKSLDFLFKDDDAASVIARSHDGAASMLTAALCLVLGDSIAVKISKLRPSCDAFAQNGLNSSEIEGIAPQDKGYRRVIVSMGSNDRGRSGLSVNLAAVRAKYPRAKFTWLAPIKPANGNIVTKFALSWQDKLVSLDTFPSRDRVHPLDYSAVNQAIGSGP